MKNMTPHGITGLERVKKYTLTIEPTFISRIYIEVDTTPVQRQAVLQLHFVVLWAGPRHSATAAE
jgi:L-lysine 2,3-aminomutase